MKNFISSQFHKVISFKFLLSVPLKPVFYSIFTSSLQFFFLTQKARVNVSSSLSIRGRLFCLRTRLDHCIMWKNRDIQSFLSLQSRKVVPFLLVNWTHETIKRPMTCMNHIQELGFPNHKNEKFVPS